MAYNKKELERLALEAIALNGIAWIKYLIPHLPCASSTFYNLEMEKVESIKEALQNKRIARKEKLISKWEESDNATLNIAAFKLLADDQELDRLSNAPKEDDNIVKKVIYYDATGEDA